MDRSATLKELMLGIRDNEKIFAVDLNLSGQKYFLRGDRRLYIPEYQRAVKEKRAHWYEVLLENRPCPLVLDIESTEKTYVQSLPAIETLMKIFKIAIESQTGQMDEYYYLDSSSSKKASFHIVGRVLFKNLAHVGALVRNVWCAIQSIITKEINLPDDNIDIEKLKYIFDSKNNWIVDDCIYTRNRLFRIPLSSKKGSARVLRPVKSMGRQSENWYDYLVQKGVSDTVYEWREMGDIDPVFTSMPARRCIRKIDDEWIMTMARKKAYQTSCKVVNPFLLPVLNKLDDMGFMTKRDINFNSGRRSWNVNSHSKMCGIAGREHAGNHIWFEIDGLGGSVYQRCFDYNCTGFKEIDVGDAWDNWTVAWTTMVNITDIMNSLSAACGSA